MNNALYEACLLSQNEWINSFMPLEEHVFSKRHERKMEALFWRIRNDKYHKLTKNAVRAIIIAAIILSLALTALAIEIAKAYNAYNITEGTVYNAIGANGKFNENLNVGFIPYGYNLDKDIDLHKMMSKKYASNGGDLIVVEKYVLDSESILNTTIYQYEEIFNNNIRYFYYSSNNLSGIIWVNNNYIYSISSSSLSKEELLLMAYSTE